MAASQAEAMKAYAAVMLNMAQESAARVLAAERRAAALEAALAAAKEDGVATLLRLKAIMEARIKEVELRSSQHVKKIKELEAQLHKMKELEEQLYGAKNNVTALEFELQVANTELENTRKTLAEERMNRFPANKKMDSNIRSSCSKMNLQSETISFKHENTAENGAAQNTQNIYHHRSPDLPSFMERNKKPKLYHSGWTQRIHALKQRNQGGDACQEQNHKHGTRLNSRSKTRKKDTAKNPCTRSITEQLLGMKFLGQCKRKRGSRSRPCYDRDSSGEIREVEYKVPDTSDTNGCLLLLQALEKDLSPLKVSAEHGEESLSDLKDDSLMNRRDADLNLSTASPEPELIDILADKDKLVKRKKRSRTVRVLEAEFSDPRSIPESDNTLLRSTSNKSMSDAELTSEMKDNDSDTLPGSNGPVMQHTTMNLKHQDGANKSQHESGNSSALLLSCNMSQETALDYGNLLVEPYANSACLKEVNRNGSCSLGELESGNNSSRLLQSCETEVMDHGNLLVEQSEQEVPYNKSACLKEAIGEGSCSLASHKADASTVTSLNKEDKFTASSGLPIQASEKPDASVGSFLHKEEHAKASSGASIRVEGSRQIKYTFNRRKRKSMSTDNTPLCAIPKKSSKLLSAPKKGEPHPNAETQDILIDSPQGDNSLVQVAQRLILLSECN